MLLSLSYLVLLNALWQGSLAAMESSVTVSTDRQSYFGVDTIRVSGFVFPIQGDIVTLTIKTPSGVTIAVANGTLDEDNGGYAVLFKTGGKGWEANGTYTVTVLWLVDYLAQVAVTNRTIFMYTTYVTTTTTITIAVISTQSASTPANGTSSLSKASNNESNSFPLNSYILPGAIVVVIAVAVTTIVARKKFGGDLVR